MTENINSTANAILLTVYKAIKKAILNGKDQKIKYSTVQYIYIYIYIYI